MLPVFRSLSPALQASQHAGRAGLLSDPFLLPLKLLLLEEALYPSPNKTQLPRTHMYKKKHCTTPLRLPPPVLLGLPWVTLGRVSQVGREWEDAGTGRCGLRPGPPYRAQPSCPRCLWSSHCPGRRQLSSSVVVLTVASLALWTLFLHRPCVPLKHRTRKTEKGNEAGLGPA